MTSGTAWARRLRPVGSVGAWQRLDEHLEQLHRAAGTDVRAPRVARVLQFTLREWRTDARSRREHLDRIADAGVDPVRQFAGRIPTAAALSIDDRDRARIVHLLVNVGWLERVPTDPARYRPRLGQPIAPAADPART